MEWKKTGERASAKIKVRLSPGKAITPVFFIEKVLFISIFFMIDALVMHSIVVICLIPQNWDSLEKRNKIRHMQSTHRNKNWTLLAVSMVVDRSFDFD